MLSLKSFLRILFLPLSLFIKQHARSYSKFCQLVAGDVVPLSKGRPWDVNQSTAVNGVCRLKKLITFLPAMK